MAKNYSRFCLKGSRVLHDSISSHNLLDRILKNEHVLTLRVGSQASLDMNLPNISLPPQHIPAHAWVHPPRSHTSVILWWWRGWWGGVLSSQWEGRRGRGACFDWCFSLRQGAQPHCCLDDQAATRGIKRRRWKTGSDMDVMTVDSCGGGMSASVSECRRNVWWDRNRALLHATSLLSY